MAAFDEAFAEFDGEMVDRSGIDGALAKEFAPVQRPPGGLGRKLADFDGETIVVLRKQRGDDRPIHIQTIAPEDRCWVISEGCIDIYGPLHPEDRMPEDYAYLGSIYPDEVLAIGLAASPSPG